MIRPPPAMLFPTSKKRGQIFPLTATEPYSVQTKLENLSQDPIFTSIIEKDIRKVMYWIARTWEDLRHHRSYLEMQPRMFFYSLFDFQDQEKWWKAFSHIYKTKGNHLQVDWKIGCYLPRYIGLPRNICDSKAENAGWSGLYRATRAGPNILFDQVKSP